MDPVIPFKFIHPTNHNEVKYAYDIYQQLAGSAMFHLPC